MLLVFTISGGGTLYLLEKDGCAILLKLVIENFGWIWLHVITQ